MLTTAATDADTAAVLLHSLIPASVRRAEWNLLRSNGTEAEQCNALRLLLQFHAEVVTPISESFAYALPSGAALDAIRAHAPNGVIEVGAGNGLWASLLRRHGVCVLAMDDGVRYNGRPISPFCHITLGGSRELCAAATSDEALLLCWPPLELELPSSASIEPNLSALSALSHYQGRRLIVIGEWRGHTGLISSLSWRTQECGITDGLQFQSMVERDWVLVERVSLPRWPGFRDELRIFYRKVHTLAAHLPSPPSVSSDPAPETPRPRAKEALLDPPTVSEEQEPQPLGTPLSIRERILALDESLGQNAAVLAAVIVLQEHPYRSSEAAMDFAAVVSRS